MHTAGPATGDSTFQIGSVTKVGTAILLAEAVARGEMTLDMPLADCLPGDAGPGPDHAGAPG